MPVLKCIRQRLGPPPVEMQACLFAGSCNGCQSQEPSKGDLKDTINLAKVHIEKSYSVLGLTGMHLESTVLLLGNKY